MNAEVQLLPLLKRYFGFTSFRPLQEEIIRDALAGRDVFALLPTGGGKSLCFQLPALARAGLTVVVSPLIALMKDQVDALQAAGVDISRIDPSTFQLMRADREIATRVQGAGKDVTLDFYGQASDSPYTAYNVYWLTWGSQKGKRMEEQEVPPAGGAIQDSFRDVVRLEQPTFFVPQPGNLSQSWFWQSLTAPATTTITLTLPAAIPSQAQVQVNLWGLSQDVASPDHHLRLFFNDTRVADEFWDGQGPRSIRGDIPAIQHP